MFPRIFAIAFLLVGSARIPGQDQFQEVPAEAQTVYVADGLLPNDKHHEIINCGKWRSDLIFGLPIALRVQRRIADIAWVEGGLALYAIVPSVFVGVRADGRIYEGKRNAWFSQPGFDFYFSPEHGSSGIFNGQGGSIFAFTFENDFTWRRAWSERLHGHLGLKVGFGVGFGGGDVLPVPILGVTCGFQY